MISIHVADLILYKSYKKNHSLLIFSSTERVESSGCLLLGSSVCSVGDTGVIDCLAANHF